MVLAMTGVPRCQHSELVFRLVRPVLVELSGRKCQLQSTPSQIASLICRPSNYCFRTLSISSELSLMYFSSLDCQSSRRTKPNRSYNLFGATSCRRQKCANKTRTLARQALWKILDYFILKWINRTCIVFIGRMSKTRKT